MRPGPRKDLMQDLGEHVGRAQMSMRCHRSFLEEEVSEPSSAGWVKTGQEKNVREKRVSWGIEENESMTNWRKFYLVRIWRAGWAWDAGSLYKMEKRERKAGVLGRALMSPVSLLTSPNTIWKVKGSRKHFKKGTDSLGLHFRKTA